MELAQVRDRAWKAANPERVKLTRKAHYWADPEKAKAARKAYYTANPDRFRKYELTRRARKAGAFVELVDPVVVFERDAGVCQLCDDWVLDGEEWHVDHRIPLARGGEHSYANTQLAHGTCNLSKGARVA